MSELSSISLAVLSLCSLSVCISYKAPFSHALSTVLFASRSSHKRHRKTESKPESQRERQRKGLRARGIPMERGGDGMKASLWLPSRLPPGSQDTHHNVTLSLRSHCCRTRHTDTSRVGNAPSKLGTSRWQRRGPPMRATKRNEEALSGVILFSLSLSLLQSRLPLSALYLSPDQSLAGNYLVCGQCISHVSGHRAEKEKEKREMKTRDVRLEE